MEGGGVQPPAGGGPLRGWAVGNRVGKINGCFVSVFLQIFVTSTPSESDFCFP